MSLTRPIPKDAPRAWIRLPSGRRLDLLAPTPFDWTDEDLAIGLSRTFRWGGHSTWPAPLSVAQHSLAVLLLRRARALPHRATHCGGNCCMTGRRG
jgi:hypothetical protein